MEDLYCWQSKFESCYYSDRLIKKIILLNKKNKHKIDLHQIIKAIYYAKKYHSTQKRDSGEPFYTHPLAVAEMIADYCFETDVLVTSILHDTIEDTEITKQTLNYIFDEKIAEQVDNLSRIKFNKKISVGDNIKLLFDLRQEKMLLIKLIDRLHNLQTLEFKLIIKQKETVLETLKEFLLVASHLGVHNLEIEIAKYCFKFNNPLMLKSFYLPRFSFQDICQFSSLDLQNAINQQHSLLELEP